MKFVFTCMFVFCCVTSYYLITSQSQIKEINQTIIQMKENNHDKRIVDLLNRTVNAVLY